MNTNYAQLYLLKYLFDLIACYLKLYLQVMDISEGIKFNLCITTKAIT